MATLTVTSEGQVTFQREVLEHLGVEPGATLEIDLLPDGRAALRGARPAGRMQDFLGMLAGKTTKVATLEEIETAIQEGWAGKR